ncbi:hypothetical protein [Dyella silvatica]|uniref:hypothetical protein n=1 Tax=Dyella silvatica TaxID=2992128 RepID=UPI0022599F0E|nr:hypothetical protein [Dyella silvatica]
MALRQVIYAAAVLLLLACSGCALQKEADAKFGDQNFKTSIALVELYHTRYGVYPETLREIKFAGDWDALALNSVRYKRDGNGYDLDVVRGWVGAPELSFPAEFWHGLGIVSSNVGGAPRQTPGM